MHGDPGVQPGKNLRHRLWRPVSPELVRLELTVAVAIFNGDGRGGNRAS